MVEVTFEEDTVLRLADCMIIVEQRSDFEQFKVYRALQRQLVTFALCFVREDESESSVDRCTILRTRTAVVKY